MKVGIIGTGLVGSTAAYAITLEGAAKGIVSELWPSLSDHEYDALEQSTSVIGEAAQKLGY